jgi:uncharacterized membrane protein
MARLHFIRRFLSSGTDVKVLHETFRAGIFIKGIDGILEIIGGAILYVVSPLQINRLVLLLTSHELSEDPRDIIASHLVRWAGHLSVHTKLFGSFYLASHGIMKTAIVLLLWRGRLSAYPAAIVFFSVFILYQGYRYSYSHSIWLIFLSVFDIIIIVLTWLEYQRMRREKGNPQGS